MSSFKIPDLDPTEPNVIKIRYLRRERCQSSYTRPIISGFKIDNIVVSVEIPSKSCRCVADIHRPEEPFPSEAWKNRALVKQKSSRYRKQEQAQMTSTEIQNLRDFLKHQLAESKTNMEKQFQQLADNMATGFEHQKDIIASVDSRLSTEINSGNKELTSMVNSLKENVGIISESLSKEINSQTGILDKQLIGLKESVDRGNKKMDDVETESRSHFKTTIGSLIAIVGLIITLFGGSWYFGNKNNVNTNNSVELKSYFATVSEGIEKLSESQKAIQEQLQRIQPAKQQ